MESAARIVTTADMEQMNTDQLKKWLTNLLREKKGWKCLATIIDEKDEEINQLKEAVTNYEEGMELAEYRATILQEHLEKLHAAYVNKEPITDIKPSKAGLYLPSTMKQVIEMITTENSQLHKALANSTKFANGVELVRKNQELERQVQVLEEKFSRYEELINDVRLGNTGNQGLVNTLLLEKLSLQDDVDKLKTYSKSLREKNTCLLAQLAEKIDERGCDLSKESHHTSMFLQEGEKNPIMLSENQNTVLKDNLSGTVGEDVEPVVSSVTNQETMVGSTQLLDQPGFKEYQELKAKHEMAETEKYELKVKLKQVTEAKEEQEKSYTEIVKEMNARVSDANSEVFGYKITCKDLSDELKVTKEKLARLEREWREGRTQIKMLERTISNLNEKINSQQHSTHNQERSLPRLRTSLPREPYAETSWSFNTQNREVLAADCAVSPNQTSNFPSMRGFSSPLPSQPDDTEPVMTQCPNCEVSYPSDLFEDHLKECN